MYKEGEKYLFHEDGAEMIVTLTNQEYDGVEMWHKFELKVEQVLSTGIFILDAIALIGSTMTVGYADGFRHYAGWSLIDTPHSS
jgi:hypothetical protein